MRRPALALCGVLLLAIAGCGLSPEARVVTSANAFAFYEARYQEGCVDVVGPATCDAEFASLNRWRRRLAEAETALGNVKKGGKLPLQLAELKRAEKETRTWRKRR